MRPLLLALALAIPLTTPALACAKLESLFPVTVTRIDGMQPRGKLSQANLKRLKALKSRAKALIAAERYDEAERVVKKAERVMGFVEASCAPPSMLQNTQATTG